VFSETDIDIIGKLALAPTRPCHRAMAATWHALFIDIKAS
jgi:hypothetical protein